MSIEEARWWVKTLAVLLRDEPHTNVTVHEQDRGKPQIRQNARVRKVANGEKGFRGLALRATAYSDGSAGVVLSDAHYLHFLQNDVFIESGRTIVCHTKAPAGFEIWSAWVPTHELTPNEQEVWRIADYFHTRREWSADIVRLAMRYGVIESCLDQVARGKMLGKYVWTST